MRDKFVALFFSGVHIEPQSTDEETDGLALGARHGDRGIAAEVGRLIGIVRDGLGRIDFKVDRPKLSAGRPIPVAVHGDVRFALQIDRAAFGIETANVGR